MEQIIRDNGAVPATIALMSGKVCVGLDKNQLEEIADTQKNKAIKVSRRDIAYTLNKVIYCITATECSYKCWNSEAF